MITYQEFITLSTGLSLSRHKLSLYLEMESRYKPNSKPLVSETKQLVQNSIQKNNQTFQHLR